MIAKMANEVAASYPGEASDFNVFAGAATGLLKGVNVNRKGVVAKNLNNMKALCKEEEEITCMSWGDVDDSIVVGLRNGAVKTFNVVDKVLTASIETADLCVTTLDPLRGVAQYDESLVAASQSGIVRVWKSREQTVVDAIDSQLGNARGTKLRRGEFKDDEEKNKHLAVLKSGRALCRMVQSPFSKHVIATGGKEVELCTWDLNKFEMPTFQSKNVKPDKLQLRVPVWISDISFMSEHAVSVVSKHGHVRLYDPRSRQRRPMLAIAWPDVAPTAAAATSEHNLVVGSGTGHVGLFDFRKPAGLVRKYRGCVGSVRSIASNGSHFATAGLDRYLRIYATNEENPLQKIYLKSPLNCVLLSGSFDPNQNPYSEGETAATVRDDPVIVVNHERDEENLESDEKFWTKLKVIRGDKKRKRTGCKSTASKRKM